MAGARSGAGAFVHLGAGYRPNAWLGVHGFAEANRRELTAGIGAQVRF